MTSVVLRRWPLRTVALQAVLLAVGAAIGLVPHRVPLPAMRRCVAPDDHLAWLGVHLDLLRADPACGPGGYALHAGPGHAAGVVLMVAVPALLANVASLASAVGVWAALRRVLARAAGAVGRLWASLPVTSPVPAPVPAKSAPCVAAGLPRAWHLDHSPVRRRGPPALRTA